MAGHPGCGTLRQSAGIFWMAEAAIALSYPDPDNQERFLGFWLSFRVGGQMLGAIISLGINAHRSTSSSILFTVYLRFHGAAGSWFFCWSAFEQSVQVQRKDGVPVQLQVTNNIGYELKSMSNLWISPKFLFIVPFLCQAVYTEPVMLSHERLWFTVRARALGSFLSGVIALIIGNLLGAFLETRRIFLKKRSRYGFFLVVGWQGMC
ncbi:hypothetical protein PDIG_06050 [Penicillium digitatum PHI26]|uniref:Uncharacterized protein n=2 Tax=Penicillium digitatum TaxID=36651 RepID=K9GWW8_PEND2|nr:hypothetical protein PDIP_10730 [Penicillium digitatum Pd1]EKV19108.1 hypothetical protein PDIG_06050 [Penicillium digitatum PHI26]EKV21017.1 hypothetical protein PDIP_10730 [Penicillium digitatum Pd1]